MALTIKEQLDIATGVVNPPDYTFEALTEQIAFNFAQDFLDNSKDLSTVSDNNNRALAQLYKEKMLNACKLVTIKRQPLTPVLQMLVAILADTVTVYQDVVDATTEQWVTFITNNIEEVLEKLAQALPEEKAQYIAA